MYHKDKPNLELDNSFWRNSKYILVLCLVQTIKSKFWFHLQLPPIAISITTINLFFRAVFLALAFQMIGYVNEQSCEHRCKTQIPIHLPNNTTKMMLIIADIAIGCSEFDRNIFIRFQNMKCAVDCGVHLVACRKHKKRGSLGARWMSWSWERMRGVGVRESMLLVVRCA